MLTALTRTTIIIFACMLFQSFFNYTKYFNVPSSIQCPLIISLTPYILTIIPVLGLSDIIKSNIFSLAFLIIATIIIQTTIIDNIKNKDDDDYISTFINEKETSINQFSIKNDFIVLLLLVMFSEFFFQYHISSYLTSQEEKRWERSVLKALETFHKKK